MHCTQPGRLFGEKLAAGARDERAVMDHRGVAVGFDGVSQQYALARGRVHALRDVNLEIPAGSLTVLLGPSGSGKTTALRLLAGLEEPTEGDIRIDGRSMRGVAPRDRDVAMVFQDYALYPHMTVQENMAFGLRMRGVGRTERNEAVVRAAAMLGIEHLLNRRPHALSGGEQQRVALGRAIVRRPRVFLMDEPLSNLDARLRLHMRTELRTLQRQLGTTTVHVTHDQEEALTLADHLAVLIDGRLRQFAPPLTIYREPADREIAEFVGAPPMNLQQFAVAADGAVHWARGEWGRVRLPNHVASALVESRGVVIGFRPEAARWFPRHGTSSCDAGGESDSSGGLTIPDAAVDLVEPVGPHTHIYARTSGDRPVVVRVEPSCAPELNWRGSIHVPAAGLHFFSAGTDGRRLPTA